ncbi:ABC transporter substrate-binding protein [Anaerotignum sp.]|nr:ABC transporter substrate-binding protein [Anaerotignum sp.]MBQ7758214.1 ABC transporter substrate-binding protein [Anaerotignum sp.]
MKKWMKMVATMMVAAMALTACGGSEAPADDAASGETYTVGIIQQLEHPALDAATQGFQDKLTELLGDSVTFDYQNAQGEQTNCTTIATKFVSNEVDLIMANATTALQSAAAATGDIPIVGTSVTDYVTAGVVDSNEAPGKNVTGASDLAPIDQQIAMLLELVPDVTKVGIVYCSAEPNSIYQSQLAQAELDKAGVAWAEYTAADSNEVQSVVTKAVSECDVLYVPTDNTMANNTEIIKNVAVPAGIPVIAGEEGICSGCGIATLSISYYDLGVKAAEMAYEILVNGANPAEMPIEYVSDGITEKYNPEIVEALGMTVPEGMVAIGE